MPPDTIKDLLLKQNAKKVPSKSSKKKKVSFLLETPKLPTNETIVQTPNYLWNKNSCCLDTSLQLLYVIILKALKEFACISNALPKDLALQTVFPVLLDQHTMDPNGKNMSAILYGHRNNICRLLK